jgi:hypothetical protein
MAGSERNSDSSGSGRDRYRDDDDVRAPLSSDERMEAHPDTKSEARGDARENAGNTARGTAAAPTEGGNDTTKHRRDEKID